MKITAASPAIAVKAAIAICWPTEYAATTVAPALVEKTLTSSACWTPAPPGVNGTAPATWPTAKTSSTFWTEAPTRKASSRNQNAPKRHSHATACSAATSRR